MLDTTTCLNLAAEKHFCPYCQSRLSCCNAPPFHIGDGLGWGTEIFFVCLNDECSLYVNSWKQFEDNFGHNASCRYILLPGEKSGSAMMVGGKDAFKGCVLDPEKLIAEDTRFVAQREAIAKLDSAAEAGDIAPALLLLLDEMAPMDIRKRCCEILETIGSVATIDSIRNHKFYNQEMESFANATVDSILRKNFLKECPYCAELVKTKASLCKHCGKTM